MLWFWLVSYSMMLMVLMFISEPFGILVGISILSVFFFFILSSWCVWENTPDFPVKYLFQEALSNYFLYIGMSNCFEFEVQLSLLMKLGFFPFHGWVFDMTKFLSMFGLGFFLSIHKFYPMVLIINMLPVVKFHFIIVSGFLICIMMLFLVEMKHLVVQLSQLSAFWIIMASYQSYSYLLIYLMIIILFTFFLFKELSYNSSVSVFFSFFCFVGVPPFVFWVVKMMIISILSGLQLFIILMVSGVSMLSMYIVMIRMFVPNISKVFKWYQMSQKYVFFVVLMLCII